METKRIVLFVFRLALAGALAAAGLIALPRGANAADLTIEADTLEDSNDPAYQACTNAPNDCSLRGAISKANADSTNSYTLLLQTGAIYNLTLDGAWEINNATGDLNIRVGMTIDGRGARIEPSIADRALRIMNGDVTIKNLTIANSHLLPGPIGGSAESGGGVYIQTSGTVRLENCTIRDNTAGHGGPGLDGDPAGIGTSATNGGKGGSGGSGGGIYISGSTQAVILDRVTLYNNRAGSGGPGGRGGAGNANYPGGAGGAGGSAGLGGGIYLASTSTVLTLINTTVRGNRAGDGGAGGPGGQGGDNPVGAATNGGAGGSGGWASGGGGIYTSTLIANQSLIYENHAGNAGNGGSGGAGGSGNTGGNGGTGGDGGLAGEGGGVRLYNPVPNRLTNTTLYQNAAGLGGIGGAGGARGVGITVSGTAGAPGATQYNGGGGGMYVSGASPVYLNFVTITENTGRLGAGIKNHGTVYARSSIIAGNSMGDVDIANVSTPFYSDGYNLFGSNVYNRVASDQVVTDAAARGLLPLADNGGPSLTVALTKGSPAVGFAPCADRDGQPVTVDQRGKPRPLDGSCDSGAYQTQNQLIPVQFFPLVDWGG